MQNDLSKVLPSVKPEFFSSPHAWEVDDSAVKVDKKPQKQKQIRKSPSKPINKHQTGSASREMVEKPSASPTERKAKKELFLQNIQSKKKGNAEKIVKPLLSSDHKGSKKSTGKSQRSVVPKPITEPKNTKLSLFEEVDDWAEAGLDGDIEFDFSELPKWD
jgi:hypothetical protein